MAEKRKISVLTLEMKKKIIVEVDKGRKRVDICKEYNLPKSTLQTFINKREKIENIESSQPAKKRHRTVKNEDLEKGLFAWFQQARAMCIPISGPIICAKADEIARKLGLDFTSNTGWLDRFKTRYNIVYKTVCGEAASVSSDAVQNWKDGELLHVLNQYEARDIFNADETGLFYKCLPNKTHTLKGEKCTGGKIPKNRLTVLVASNMDGSEKLPPLVIGKSEKPRCFRHCKQLPLPYCANKKAWMTSTIYESWIRKLDSKFKSEKRKVAMVVDNCPAHPVVHHLEAMEIVKLPPNTTSLLQPCDQGIIAALKRHYRGQMITKLLLHIDEGNDITTFDVSVLDAMYDLRTAWNNVTAATIENCFRHCGFVAPSSHEPTESESDSSASKSASMSSPEYGNIFDRLRDIVPSIDTTIQEFFEVDNEVLTTEMMSTEDIISTVVSSPQEDEDQEETDSPPKPLPTAKDARAAIDTLRTFLQLHKHDEAIIDTLSDMSMYVNKVAVETAKQSSMTDFFKPATSPKAETG